MACLAKGKFKFAQNGKGFDILNISCGLTDAKKQRVAGDMASVSKYLPSQLTSTPNPSPFLF